MSDNTCSNNEIGIYLINSNQNIVIYNTCIGNTEHDIHLDDSDSNTVENNFVTLFIITTTDLVVLLLLLVVGITLLGAEWRIAFRASRWAEERQRIALEKSKKDYIIVPTTYRLASWLRKRRSLKHVDVDENHELESSDQ
jgi:parallel beta-helix repeat protein